MTEHSSTKGTGLWARLLGKPEHAVLLAALWMVSVCNFGFWQTLAQAGPDGLASLAPFLACYFVVSVALVAFILLILSSLFSTRIVLTIALPVAAAAGYFTTAYGTLFDSEMLVNVLQTNPAEASELATVHLLLYVGLAGLLPVVVLWRARFPKRNVKSLVLQRVAAFLLVSIAMVGALAIESKQMISAARAHHELRHMIAPVNVLAAGVSLLQDQFHEPLEFQAVAADARHVAADVVGRKPIVHVLIVGETARAASFSLAGYERDTNPRLAGRSDLYFDVAQSCGTATAVSVPCMFSLQQHDGFDREITDAQENFLDIAARTGFEVYWIDNGNSCKGVCDRVRHWQMHDGDADRACDEDVCFDGALIDELDGLLERVTTDTVVVLHELGSHGPLYYKRYPDEFRVFAPDCRSANFGDCSPQEIVNAYDNTIAYTDYVIEGAIDTLASYADKYEVSLVYVSDHGESLGEHDLYLHGMPYGLAPKEQTEVPFIAWLGSDGNAASCDHGINHAAPSHDNLFHTELGLLGISTEVYREDLDLFSTCRSIPSNLSKRDSKNAVASKI